MKKTEIKTLVSKLTRQEVVNILENASIQCYDSESTKTLKTALIENVLDGTISANEL